MLGVSGAVFLADRVLVLRSVFVVRRDCFCWCLPMCFMFYLLHIPLETLTVIVTILPAPNNKPRKGKNAEQRLQQIP